MKKINSLGVMIDCSRDAVYTIDTLESFFKLISEMGYNYVQLYTEDTYEIDGKPYFGYMRGKYTKCELKEIDCKAKKYNLELIPCIQTLAHLGGVTRWDEYAGEFTDSDGILLSGEERTYELIEGMFKTCAECFTSRRINIGMDEANMIGLGKYLDKHGYVDRMDILLGHLNRVLEIAKKYGFSAIMWSDMFFRLVGNGAYETSTDGISSSIADMIPDVDMIYWDYGGTDEAQYRNMIKAHRKLGRKVVFAGGSWTWSGFVPDNKYAIKASETALRACIKESIDDVFITCWKDDGAECSLFGALPTLMCVAEFARGNFDYDSISEKFLKIVGVDYESFIAIEDMNLKNGRENALSNPSKYMLYCDPFLGIFDLTVCKADAEKLLDIGKRLKAVKFEMFNYVFETLSALCDVLAVKYTLGADTRAAYKNRDKKELSELTEKYKELESLICVFYDKFRAQWEKECKLYGFEKHDIRIGGLIMRIKHCRGMLEEYIAGKRNEIPMLEEELLKFKPKVPNGQSVFFNDWLYTASIKPRL